METPSPSLPGASWNHSTRWIDPEVIMGYIIALAVIILLFLIYLFLIAPGRFPSKGNRDLWKTKYAHRGLHSRDEKIPENSLAAFSLAAESGYGIELDLQLTLDGQIVVFHDDSLKRVCGVDKLIWDCTYAELQQYRLSGTDQRIPLFTEVLALVNSRVPFILELKTSKRHRELCEKTAPVLDVYTGPYCIESFNPAIVSWFRKNRPQVVRGQLSSGYKDFGVLPIWQAMLLSSLMTNVASRPHFVAFRHEDSHHKLKLGLYRLLGGKLVGWTVRDTDDRDYCFKFFDTVIFEFFKP